MRLFLILFLPLKNSDNKKINEVNSHWNSANEKRIISVGSLKQQKNHSLLINAFAIVNTNLPSKLMIIGEGEERNKFRNQVKIMGLENQVIFAGFQKDINPFYQTADLFVLSSNYEGFGNVLLEALINGVNIVSTDCKSGLVKFYLMVNMENWSQLMMLKRSPLELLKF